MRPEKFPKSHSVKKKIRQPTLQRGKVCLKAKGLLIGLELHFRGGRGRVHDAGAGVTKMQQVRRFSRNTQVRKLLLDCKSGRHFEGGYPVILCKGGRSLC